MIHNVKPLKLFSSSDVDIKRVMIKDLTLGCQNVLSGNKKQATSKRSPLSTEQETHIGVSYEDYFPRTEFLDLFI